MAQTRPINTESKHTLIISPLNYHKPQSIVNLAKHSSTPGGGGSRIVSVLMCLAKGNSVDKAELLVFNEFLSETKTGMFTECEERRV